MITPVYAQTMARYNRWQNQQLQDVLGQMSTEDLMLDCGAFFGSILRTLNHLMWGDMLWLQRLDPGQPDPMEAEDAGCTLFGALETWAAARTALDARIIAWADALEDADVRGDVTVHLRTTGHMHSFERAASIAHFFNHQTHHRGQVHAMITAAGRKAPVNDLIFMPKE